MEDHEIRIKALLDLIGDVEVRGAVAAFAKEHGLDANLISQWKNGSRKMGRTAAKGVERQLNLPDKYLERLHNDEREEMLHLINEELDKYVDVADLIAVYSRIKKETGRGKPSE